MSEVNRRDLLAMSGAAMASSLVKPSASLAEDATDAQPAFRFCLNMSTIRGQELTLPEQIRVAASAGYQGIEPWVREIREYLRSGGTARDLRNQLNDAGLAVESAIGFAKWIVDDDRERADGFETAQRDMALIKDLGGSRIAAPPYGFHDRPGLDLLAAASRYRALCELGDRMGVLAQLELWGHSKSLNRLGELLFIASESGHPSACMLPDVYHIYKGGSDFEGLRLANGQTIHVFHMNDYPATPDRESIKDEHRVFPGDGIAPLSAILRTMHATGFRGALSLELFNRSYWKRDAKDVAKEGLEKMKTAVERAFA